MQRVFARRGLTKMTETTALIAAIETAPHETTEDCGYDPTQPLENARWEHFAQALDYAATASIAYTTVYGEKPNMLANTLYKCASELKRKILPRLRHIRRQREAVTLDEVRQSLRDVRDDAIQGDDGKSDRPNALRAIEGLGKTAGAFVDRVHQTGQTVHLVINTEAARPPGLDRLEAEKEP